MDIGTIKKNSTRIGNMTKKTSTAGISRRKLLRAMKKGFIDKENEEGTSYSAGGF